MRYNRISADCHLDLIWLPPELFVSEAARELKDRMPYIRVEAARALWRANPASADRAVAALLQELRNESLEVRKQAAVTLGKLGPAAAAAILRRSSSPSRRGGNNTSTGPC